MSVNLTRWGAPASLLAGALWLLVWAHQQVAHGPTQVNEMRLVAGLTWMDSSKLLVLPFGLLSIALWSLDQRRRQPGRLASAGRAITFGGLGLLIVATALEFWSFPWGSYAVRFEDATGLVGSDAAGMIQLLDSLVFTLGLVVLGADLVRSGVLSIWPALALVAGGFATLFLSPVFLVPGAAWIILGLVLLQPSRAGAEPGPPEVRA